MRTTTPSARRTTAAAVGALGLLTAVGIGAASPAAAGPGRPAAAHTFRGPLVDLQPGLANPTDGARARLTMASANGSSTFVLVVSGVSAKRETFGAHLHTGPCVAGDGAAAGPHYNQSRLDGVVPPVVSNRTEVWLDVTIGPGGVGVATARVPFVPTAGSRSLVLHAEHTHDNGTAGARMACLPVTLP